MSLAALLLAAAALLAGPVRPRRRIGHRPAAGRPGRGARRRPQQHERPGEVDPFASAAAFDVFAVCLSSGMPVAAAAAATAPLAPEALRSVLQRAADVLALGGDPDSAWLAPPDADESCQALMRLARRSAHSGSSLARAVADLAEQSRRQAADTASAASERAGVLIAGPLGLCFLPAFICLGIVPVIAGLTGEVFTGVLS